MSTTLGLKVDVETRERLNALADQLDRSPHWIIKTALAEYLDRQERAGKERQEDLARWERFVMTGEAVPHAEAREWLEKLASGERSPWR